MGVVELRTVPEITVPLLPLTHRIASAVFQSLRLFNLQTLTPQRLDDRRNNPQLQLILSCVETNATRGFPPRSGLVPIER